MASSKLDDNVQLIQLEFGSLAQHVATTTGPQAKKRKISSVRVPNNNKNHGSHEKSPNTIISIDLDKESVCLCNRKFDYNVISPSFLHKDLCSNFDLVSDGVYRVSTSDIRLGLDANNCLLLVQSKKSTRPSQKLLFALAIPHLQPEFDLLWCEIYLLNLTSAKLARNNIQVTSHLQLDFDTKSNTIAIALSYRIAIQFDIHKPSHLDVIDKINILVDAYFKPSPIENIDPVQEPVSPHLFYSFVSRETSKLPSVPQDFEIPELDTNLLRFQSKSVNWLLGKENVKYDYTTNRCTKIPLIDSETSLLLERYIVNDPDLDLQELENKVYQILNKLCFGWDKVVKSGKVYFYNKYTAGIVPITSVCKQLLTYNEDSEAQKFLPAQGLLAEVMGLGKTVEITALVLMNQRPTEEINEPMQIQNNSLSDFRTIVKAKTTLIIAPESILRQWVLEVENLAPSLAVTIYKGIGKYPKLDNNPALIAEYLRKFDMVFSTYSTISKELDYAKFTSRNRTTRNSIEKNNSYREYLERDSAINPSSSGSEVTEADTNNFELLNQISANLQKPKIANIRSNGKYEDTDYERALQDEINLAIKHNKIPEIYKRINYESPLMLTHFWRVVLDEVQMVSSKYSRAFQSAALIPRFHAWGVSGTPIKKNLTDLHSILEFLKYFPFYGDLGKKGWQNLIASREDFMKLWKRLAIRHTKAMVHEDIQLPPQRRVLLTIPFTPIEQDNYNQLYEECLSSICLDEDGNPSSADWAPSASVMMYMSSWLQKLRQICNNPQIGQLSITSKKYKRSYLHLAISVIQKLNTLDSLLDDMLTKASGEIADVERLIIQIYMEVGDFFEFIYLPQEALKFLRIGAKEAEKIIFRTNLDLERCLAEQKALSRETKLTDTEEKRKENWINDPKLERLDEKIRSLRIRIRNWNIYLHKFYFLIASGYFQCYDEEYLEITKKRGFTIDQLNLPAELLKLETFVDLNKTEEIANLLQLPLKSTFISQIRDHPDVKDEKIRAETFSNMEKEYYSLAENVRRDILQSSIEAVTML
jgi:E3 ubiquitin-protein ligase SHPRH